MKRSVAIVVAMMSIALAGLWAVRSYGTAQLPARESVVNRQEPAQHAVLGVGGEHLTAGASAEVGFADGAEPGVHVDALVEGEPWVGGVMTATAVMTVPTFSLLLKEHDGPPVAVKTGLQIAPALTVTWVSPHCDVCGEVMAGGDTIYEWTTSLGVEEPYTITAGLEGVEPTSGRGVGLEFWGADATVGGDAFNGSLWAIHIGTSAASPGTLQKRH